MADFSDKELFGYLISGVLPLLISVIQKPTWSDRKRSLVALLVVWATMLLWWLYMWASESQGAALTLTVSVLLQVVRMMLGSLVVAMTTYQNLWKPTGIAQRVEAMTTPGQGKPKRDLIEEAERRETPPRTPEAT